MARYPHREEKLPPELVEQAAKFMVEGYRVPRRYWPALGWWALRGLHADRRRGKARAQRKRTVA
jgi:hypothetical protein